jgi:GNAT superfamily N-acetyltransferase
MPTHGVPSEVAEPSWGPIDQDPAGALELLDTAVSDARAEGNQEEMDGWASQRTAIHAGKTSGRLLRGPDGTPWGMAIWTVLKGRGRRVAPIYLRKDRQNPAGWTQFLRYLLESPEPAGPVLLFNTPLTGLPEAEAAAFLGPRGFRPYHRYGLAFPPGGPLPAEPSRPLVDGRLRTLSPEDLEPLAALSATCYANSVDRFMFGEEAESMPAARWLLRSFFDGRYGTFIAEASFGLELHGKLMGATLVSRLPAHKLLADVEVHPSVQGQGHARRLIRATIEALSADVETPLVLAVTRENGVAFQLYQDLGFVVRQGPFPFWANPAALGVPPPTS